MLSTTYKGRLGRLQRQALRCFWANNQEVSARQLREWCWPWWPDHVTEYQRQTMIRAARSIGAVRVRREWREWVWRYPPRYPESDDKNKSK
jgi:hypothetical protein